MTKNTRLLDRWYLPLAAGVNRAEGLAVVALLVGTVVSGLRAQTSSFPAGDMDCSAHWTRLFAPADPDDRGTYRVCRSSRPINDLADAHWTVGSQAAAEAFAGAAPGARRALALLYGGRRLQVIRGWRRIDESVESVTLIAPPPDASMTRITDGTLIVTARVSR